MTPATLPHAWQQVLIFGIGCCLGSFYNVVIYRLPRKQSIVRPGSRCPHCLQPIAARHNLPLLSYLLLRGRCAQCGAAISPRYPLVEALTGVFALVLFRRYGWHGQWPIEFFFVSLLLIIAFIDLDTLLIPDVLSLSGIAVGFATAFISRRLAWPDSLLGILFGGGLFYLIAVGYRYFRRQEGLGGGDIKLLAMIGAFLGLPGVMFTVLVASTVGTVVGLMLMRRSGRGMTTMLPFGPFLALGAVCYLFWGEWFYSWYFTEFPGV